MRKLFKPSVFLLSAIPFVYICGVASTGSLGPDPAKVLVLFTGIWALRFLLLTLAVTPLRKQFGWSLLIRVRRMLGLYTFFYATVHLLAVITFIMGWSFNVLLEELVERPYIAVGFSAWLLLLPLAITSTKSWVARLGKRWQQLHRAVYVVVPLALLHFIWLVRSDYREPLVYVALFTLLFLPRLKNFFKVYFSQKMTRV